MRSLLALLLAGCSTVESSRLVSTLPGREKCERGELVAEVFPSQWPNVIVEVREQRVCLSSFEDRIEVTRELRTTRGLATAFGAALGAGVGLASIVLLAKYHTPTGAVMNQGDGWLMLPLAGGVAGGMLAESLHAEPQVQQLGGEIRVETRTERRDEEVPAPLGLLTQEGRPLAELRHGRASVPLELAMAIYPRPMQLDSRRVYWSVRAQGWVPGRLPACVRAADAWAQRDFERLPAVRLSALEYDAERCAKDGWPFAVSMLGELANTCRGRFGSSCFSAVGSQTR